MPSESGTEFIFGRSYERLMLYMFHLIKFTPLHLSYTGITCVKYKGGGISQCKYLCLCVRYTFVRLINVSLFAILK